MPIQLRHESPFLLEEAMATDGREISRVECGRCVKLVLCINVLNIHRRDLECNEGYAKLAIPDDLMQACWARIRLDSVG